MFSGCLGINQKAWQLQQVKTKKYVSIIGNKHGSGYSILFQPPTTKAPTEHAKHEEESIQTLCNQGELVAIAVCTVLPAAGKAGGSVLDGGAKKLRVRGIRGVALELSLRPDIETLRRVTLRLAAILPPLPPTSSKVAYGLICSLRLEGPRGTLEIFNAFST